MGKAIVGEQIKRLRNNIKTYLREKRGCVLQWASVLMASNTDS
jgi:hypothetical protein